MLKLETTGTNVIFWTQPLIILIITNQPSNSKILLLQPSAETQMAKSLTKTPKFPRNKETNQRVSFNNKALFDAPSAVEMQRLCNKLRTLTLSSSRRLLFQSHAPIHRPFHSAPSSKWRLSPLFNYPSSSSSHITRCCSYPSPSLAAAPSLCSSRLPLSVSSSSLFT